MLRKKTRKCFLLEKKQKTKFSGPCGSVKPKIKLFGIDAKLMLDKIVIILNKGKYTQYFLRLSEKKSLHIASWIFGSVSFVLTCTVMLVILNCKV